MIINELQYFSEVISIEEVDEIIVEDIEVENLEEGTEVEILNTACQTPTSEARYRHDWQMLSSRQRFAMNLKVEAENKCKASQNRDDFQPRRWNTDDEYWRQIYARLINHDTPKIKDLCNQFEKLRKQEKLGYAEFAEVIVTFVQHIPYVLILTKSAREALKDGEYYVNYIQRERRPFAENIKFGLHSPVEFLHTQKGDCDTRTVLLYTLLSHFGYDVVIINNPTHSMLGINLPATGTYLPYQGKKYFLWETTNTGWEIGSISPENEQGMHICLPSKNNL